MFNASPAILICVKLKNSNIVEKTLIKYTPTVTLKPYNNNINFIHFFIDTKNLNKYTNFINYQFYNLFYLQNIFKLNLKEKNINAAKILPKKVSNHILFKTRFINFKQFNIKYFNEIAYLFVTNIWLKNCKNICKYIKKKLDNVHFKQHRKYFLFFFRVLNKYIKPCFNLLKVKGLVLTFRGKLGRGGNSRKKVLSYKKGQFSLSNKMLSVNSNKWDVWTKTGTVGCYMQIFYKNMTFYLNLYLVFYVITFINLQYVIKLITTNALTQSSIPHITLYIIKFSKLKTLYLTLLLSLTGLPPFLFFFIKFNLLINLFSKLNIIFTAIIFLIFFLNMLFYVQVFMHKNQNIPLKLIKKTNKYVNYKVLTAIVYTVLLQIFSLFLFSDIVYIFKLIYNWQH